MEISGDSKNYKNHKEKLWNQPRSRKILERLEECRANQSILIDVAKNFGNGEHGEGEVCSAIFCEFLRNQDQRLILKRVSKFKFLSSRIQTDLSHLASELYQLKSWESFKVMGYNEWAEFSEEVLGFSEKITESLLIAREETSSLELDDFLQALTKGYGVPKLQENSDIADPLAYANTLREIAEFRAGEELRKRKAVELRSEKTLAEMFQKLQEKQATIDKLTKRGVH